jgi:flagellar M-ring protein FliF
MDSIFQFVSQVLKGFNALTPSKKMVVVIAAAVSLLSIWSLVFFVNQQEYRVLFSNLSNDDAGKIIARLEEKKIPYKLSPTGDSIRVPSQKVSELRLDLASSGLPHGGVVGFEIFDNKNFGVTEFVQQLNYQRALQGELARTISSLDEVQKSRVHIVIPQKSLFIEQQAKPTASVFLKLNSGRNLQSSQVDGIIRLVASSVEGLNPNEVMVVDSSGNVLSKAVPDSEFSQMTNSQRGYQKNVEKELSTRIQSMLEKVVGQGKVVAKVSATHDFQVTEKTEEVYDPEEPVVRSVHRKIEKSGTPFSGKGQSTVSPTVKQRNDVYRTSREKSDEIINYEITRVVSKTVMPVGEIKRLSVAVLVDGNYVKDDKGVETFQSRSKAELAVLENLVKKSVGFDARRGDTVVMSSAPFKKVHMDATMIEDGSWKNILTSLIPAIKFVVSLMALLLVVFIILRPLVAFLMAKGKEGGVRMSDRYVADGQLDMEKNYMKLEDTTKELPQEVEMVREMAKRDSQDFAELVRNWLK